MRKSMIGAPGNSARILSKSPNSARSDVRYANIGIARTLILSEVASSSSFRVSAAKRPKVPNVSEESRWERKGEKHKPAQALKMEISLGKSCVWPLITAQKHETIS